MVAVANDFVFFLSWRNSTKLKTSIFKIDKYKLLIIVISVIQYQCLVISNLAINEESSRYVLQIQFQKSIKGQKSMIGFTDTKQYPLLLYQGCKS